MRTFVATLLLATSSFMPSMACARSCEGIDRGLTNKRKAALAPELAKQLQIPVVHVLQSFRSGTWTIIYISAGQTDEAFLFFAKEPFTAHYVTLWSGAAAKSEQREIEEWALKNAPGIPARLAKCFAWHVTHGRNL